MSNKSTAAAVKESLTTGDRERFENWASDDGEYPKAIECVGNCYRLAQTQAYWMAWHKCSTESPAIAVIDTQAAEIERLREALQKVRPVIAADRQGLLDCHGINGKIPAEDELGTHGLYEYDGALHVIDTALSGEPT